MVVQPQPVAMTGPPAATRRPDVRPPPDRSQETAMNLSKFFIDRPIFAGVLSC
jgi:hypothetical protein